MTAALRTAAARALASRPGGVFLCILPPLAAGWLNAHAQGPVAAVFGAPAAHLAALMLGAPCATHDGGTCLQLGPLAVDITAQCGGAGFWAILWSFLCFLRLREPGRFSGALRRPLLGWALLGLGAYPLTLFANACRICAAVLVYRALHPHFGGRLDALAHEAAGVAVFLAFLIAVAFCFRHTRHTRHDATTPAA